jgi:acyl carrier protein
MSIGGLGRSRESTGGQLRKTEEPVIFAPSNPQGLFMRESQHYDEVIEVLKKIVSGILKVPMHLITADSALTDLPQVESIKLLRIAGKVERRFGIELDDETLFRKGTLSDLAQEIIIAQEGAA